jgi:hypothetical protein
MSQRSELYCLRYAVPLMALIVWCLLYGVPGFAFSEVPPGDMQCAEVTGDDGDSATDDTPYPNDRFIYIRCTFPPIISKYVRSDSSHSQYAVIMVPRYPLRKLGWTIKTDGYNARPTNCNTWPDADYNAIVMRHCPDHYPDAAIYQGSSGTGSWGGPVAGENPLGWRMAAVMKYVSDNYGHLLDKGAGATLLGCSYGGSTSILQSMLIPDPWARALVNKVRACVPPTLMVKQEAPQGNYWRDGNIRQSWGAFDWTLADVRRYANPYAYHRINGSPADTAVVFDLAFFRDVCDAQQVACFGTWHNAGHSIAEPGVNLPFGDLFSGLDSQARLDRPLIVFTDSSANYWGPRGHYNLGLEYHTAGISDTANRLAVPVRYLHRTGMGGGIPDQPAAATFSITLRRIPYFNPRPGETLVYRLAGLQGSTTAGAGEVTITGLTLQSSDQYTTLEILR